jgi:zinc protease
VAAIGGSNNAFTSYDYTVFHETVAPEALEQMMGFEADRMRNLILNDEVIATERDVVLEERRSRVDSDPGSLLEEEVNATLYQNHPYRIPVIGWMHEIERLNLKDAMAFYDRYYAPNNAVLIVAGDVEAQEVVALAEETYGRIAPNPELGERVRPSEPEQNTRRSVTLGDPRVSVPSLRRQWVVPSYNTAVPGEAEALDILAEILGGGTRSRLYQELVVRRGIARSVAAYFVGTALDAGTFTVSGSPLEAARFAEIEAAIDAEIAAIATGGVGADELEKAKRRLVRDMIFARDSQSSMAQIFGSALSTGGTVADVLDWPQRIGAVTADAVREAARRHLDQSRSTTGYLLPAAGGG